MQQVGFREGNSPCEKWPWVIFSPNRKPNDFGHSIAKMVGQYSPVIIVDEFISARRKPWRWPLCVRAHSVPEISHGLAYAIWHTPERMDRISAALCRLNVRRIAKDLDRLLPNQERLIIYDRPSQEPLVGMLRERLRIYLAVDDLTVTVEGKTLWEDLEAEKRLLSKVDIAVCVSEVLGQRLRERSQPRRTAVHVLSNGYDAQIFDPKRDSPEPGALSNVSRPRILVAGHISERIDWKGIVIASALRPAWTWVFTGPAEQGIRERICNDLGVHGFWHPPIPVTEVPAWISHCEASAVPYRLNSFTLASCPLKAIEYLAMGAPILSTRIPSLRRYDGAIQWVDEGEGESYVRALDAFAKQECNQQLRVFRQNAVVEDSWSRRVDQFKQIVFAELRLRTGNPD